MRILVSIAVLLLAAACAELTAPPPGRLALSNYSFDHARLQIVTTAFPDCGDRSAAASLNEIDLPLNGTAVIDAPPGTDICWRRGLAGARGPAPWTDWQRVFTATGRSIDSRL